ncbi:MAG: hypothetical protein PHX09_04070, partial [Clostridia bacterium]|nr:hypothetical protein [Clostridia bacterium]
IDEYSGEDDLYYWQVDEPYFTTEYIEPEISYDLKDATSCTETTITIDSNVINTEGTTFYISDIDGLLSLSAIVGGIDTSNTGHLGCGFYNSAGVANPMLGATIMLLNDINYNENFIFEMDLETGEPIIKDKTTGEITTETPISWIPIGWYGMVDLPFSGIFDGNNKVISGLFAFCLFGYIEETEIKNVGIENSYVNKSNSIGMIVGEAYNSTITGCYNAGNASGTTSRNWIAGIVGYANNCYIEDCYNIGNVNGIAEDSAIVGGIVGYVVSSTIENCYNLGNVSYNLGNVNGIAGYSCVVGGIVGGLHVSENVNSKCINCYNLGAINIAGILSSGNIRVDVGGILGVAQGLALLNCYNVGSLEVQFSTVVDSLVVNVGGIIGYAVSSVSVENCYNAGNISGINNVGGLVGGGMGSSVTVTYCHNSGLVNEAEATLDNLVGDGTEGEGCSIDTHENIISKLNEYVINYSGELDLLNWREQPEPYLVFVANEG